MIHSNRPAGSVARAGSGYIMMKGRKIMSKDSKTDVTRRNFIYGISAAGAAEINANETMKMPNKMTNFFILTSFC